MPGNPTPGFRFANPSEPRTQVSGGPLLRSRIPQADPTHWSLVAPVAYFRAHPKKRKWLPRALGAGEGWVTKRQSQGQMAGQAQSGYRVPRQEILPETRTWRTSDQLRARASLPR